MNWRLKVTVIKEGLQNAPPLRECHGHDILRATLKDVEDVIVTGPHEFTIQCIVLLGGRKSLDQL